MSDETMRWPAGGDELLDVDEDLAVALTAQGEPGVRALGLLRDARRILVGTGLERPDEITESCLRGPADALLSLPGAPAAPVGLKSAAAGLLDAVDAVPTPQIAGGGARVGQDDAAPGASTPSAPVPPWLPRPAHRPARRPPCPPSAPRVSRRRGSGCARRPRCCAGSWSGRAATTAVGPQALPSG